MEVSRAAKKEDPSVWDQMNTVGRTELVLGAGQEMEGIQDSFPRKGRIPPKMSQGPGFIGALYSLIKKDRETQKKSTVSWKKSPEKEVFSSPDSLAYLKEKKRLQNHFIPMHSILTVCDGCKNNIMPDVKKVTARIHWAARFHPIYKPK